MRELLDVIKDIDEMLDTLYDEDSLWKGDEFDDYPLGYNEDFFPSTVMSFVSSGATKFVIGLPAEYNVVVKIPYHGYCDWEWGYNGEYTTVSFFSANVLVKNNPTDWDYCQNELLLYKRAVQANLGTFFAKTERVLIGDRPYYIQEKVTAIDILNEYPSADEEASRTVSNSMQKIGCSTLSGQSGVAWCCDVYRRYGEKTLLALLLFLKENEIKDLHGYNIGWRNSDNTPCILDYAGFNE